MDSASSNDLDFRTDSNGYFVRFHSKRNSRPSILRDMYKDSSGNFFDVALYGASPTGVQAALLRPIRAHKNVLAFTSKFLYDLFAASRPPLQLSNHAHDIDISPRQCEYVIDAVDHENLRLIVKFIYTGELKIPTGIAVDVVCGILIGAKLLGIKILSRACEKFLAGGDGPRVNSENCVKMWCLARKLSCSKLMRATSTVIANNLAIMRKYAEFLKMPYDDFAKLLSSEAVVAADADLRCLAAIVWLEFDSVNRGPFVADIVGKIPLTCGSVSLNTIHEANDCGLLRKHAPDTIRKLMAGTAKKVKTESDANNSRPKP